MRTARGVTGVALIAALALSACADRDTEPRLMNLRSSTQGPDEFAIVPPKPLEMPADLASLPAPTPGGTNRTDQTPLDDAVAALGGRPGAGTSDAALAAATGRYGVSAGVRDELAAEDLAFRQRNRPKLLERMFGTSTYNRAYSREAVAQHGELERWRASGRRTPAAPPDPAFVRR